MKPGRYVFRDAVVFTGNTEYNTTTGLLRQQSRRCVFLLNKIMQQRADHGGRVLARVRVHRYPVHDAVFGRGLGKQLHRKQHEQTINRFQMNDVSKFTVKKKYAGIYLLYVRITDALKKKKYTNVLSLLTIKVHL